MQNVTIDRDKYIGGSDIPIIMGISPFKTRFDLLLEKAGLKEDNFQGNEYTEYGNIMEPKIREWFNQFPEEPYKEDKKIIGDIRCHVDGFNGKKVLEIKTTSHIHTNLEEYKLYLVQLLFYMQHMGVKEGILAIYERPTDFNEEFNEDRLRIFEINIASHLELLEEINQAVDQFRIDLEKVKENPFITEQELVPTDLTELSNKIVALENELAEMKKKEKESKELKAQLKVAMESNNIKKWETPNGVKITLVTDTPDKEIEVEYYDEVEFALNHSELHDKYHNTLAMYKKTKKEIKKGKSGYIKITLPKED